MVLFLSGSMEYQQGISLNEGELTLGGCPKGTGILSFVYRQLELETVLECVLSVVDDMTVTHN